MLSSSLKIDLDPKVDHVIAEKNCRVSEMLWGTFRKFAPGDQFLACFKKSRLESLGTTRPQQADFMEQLCGQPPRGPGEVTRGGPLPAPPPWSPRLLTEATP